VDHFDPDLSPELRFKSPATLEGDDDRVEAAFVQTADQLQQLLLGAPGA
jgi:hypothetical protein